MFKINKKLKKLIIHMLLLCMLCCVMTACKARVEPEILTFFYVIDESRYRPGAPGVVSEGFKNTSESPVRQKEDAVKLAKNEVTIDYNNISVYYDKKGDMWMVNFSTRNVDGGDQSVYIDKNGMTRLIVYGQ